MEALAPPATRGDLGDRTVDRAQEPSLAVNRGGIFVVPCRGTIRTRIVASRREDLAELVELIRCEPDRGRRGGRWIRPAARR
jgi:hypothetical protein